MLKIEIIYIMVNVALIQLFIFWSQLKGPASCEYNVNNIYFQPPHLFFQ